MSLQEETMLWKYIDGDCSVQERRAIEAMLEEDPALANSLAMLQQIHHGMQLMDLEKPSLRFTQNVLEQLPEFVHRIEFKPLIQPVYMYVLTGILILGTLLTALRLSGNPGAYEPAWSSTLEQQNSALTEFLAQGSIQYLVVFLISIVVLLVVDKLLYRVFR